ERSAPSRPTTRWASWSAADTIGDRTAVTAAAGTPTAIRVPIGRCEPTDRPTISPTTTCAPAPSRNDAATTQPRAGSVMGAPGAPATASTNGSTSAPTTRAHRTVAKRTSESRAPDSANALASDLALRLPRSARSCSSSRSTEIAAAPNAESSAPATTAAAAIDIGNIMRTDQPPYPDTASTLPDRPAGPTDPPRHAGTIARMSAVPEPAATPALALRGVGLRRDGRDLLDGIDWVVWPGQHWVLLGANGSGKTSLVRIAALYEHPSRGSVEVLGERLGSTDVRRLRTRIALVSPAMADMVRPGLVGTEV